MNCPRCGSPNESSALRCGRCQEVLQQVGPQQIYGPPAMYPGAGPGPGQTGYSAEMRMLLPVGRSGLAIVAGYLGLLSLFSPAGPLAILFAILALRDLRAHPEKHGMGRVVFAFIAGGLSTLVLLLIILLNVTR
jgi:hypothetical protein